MNWRIEVKHRKGVFDAFCEGIKKDIIDLGIDSIPELEAVQIYNIDGNLDASDLTREGFIENNGRYFEILFERRDYFRNPENIEDLEIKWTSLGVVPADGQAKHGAQHMRGTMSGQEFLIE